jgi:hypothetical protein
MAKPKVKKLEPKYYTAEEVANIMMCSTSHAYVIIKGLNSELEEMGKITISGKVSKRYFEEKLYI